MADFTQTIINTCNMFGAGPTTKWGEFTWGVDSWGEGDPMLFSVFKVLADSQTFSETRTKKSGKVVSNTVESESDCLSMVRGLGIYDYVFTKPTTDGDSQVISDYTSVTNSSDTYTTFTTVNTATWSEV